MSVEDDLSLLERELHKLQIEYKNFFSGVSLVEPYKIDGLVQGLISKYSNQPIANISLRFRYNNLVARYNSYKQFWNRKKREKEEGYAIGAKRHTEMPHGTKGEGNIRYSTTISNLESKTGNLKELYDNYIKIKKICGEPTANINFTSFRMSLLKQTKTLKEKTKCIDVDIQLTVENNQSKMVAKPILVRQKNQK